MTWFKVDDTLAFHPKVIEAGNPAMGLWVRAGSWSAQQLTNGFIPDAIVSTLDGKAAAKRLAAVGLWERVDGGWQFHNWLERQPAREDVEERREKERQKKQRQRLAGSKSSDRGEDGRFMSPRESPGDNDGDAPGDSLGVSPATRPDPTRPMSVRLQEQQVNRTAAEQRSELLKQAATVVVSRRDLTDKSRAYVAAATKGVLADITTWAADRSLVGLTAEDVAAEYEPPATAGPKLREVNGRMCQHIPGSGFVPVGAA